MSSDLVLSARNVSKTYRIFSRPHDRVRSAWSERRGGPPRCFEVPAVQPISFDLYRGQTLAIIGRNGSGKSTLLQMLAGTLSPTTGTIERHGRISALLELGTGFNPDYSGRENVRLYGTILGLNDDELDEIEPKVVAFAEIGPFIDEPVRTYSSGMYVRLAFATAVHVVPEILIVDEALAVGDIFFQQKCFAYLANELASVSKLLVTHDLSSVSRLASHCLVLDKGELVFEGAPLEAIEAYTALHLRGRAALVPKNSVAREEPLELPLDGVVGEPTVDDVIVDEPPMDNLAQRSSDPDRLRVRRIRLEKVSGDARPVMLDANDVILVDGDHARLIIDLDLGQVVEEPVFGYLVRDRLGNALFGQNTAGSGIVIRRLDVGYHQVTMDLLWPEVEGGEYSLTFGLGDGNHPLHHTIVAWVQGLLRITAIPRRPVHGSFNNDILDVQVS